HLVRIDRVASCQSSCKVESRLSCVQCGSSSFLRPFCHTGCRTRLFASRIQALTCAGGATSRVVAFFNRMTRKHIFHKAECVFHTLLGGTARGFVFAAIWQLRCRLLEISLA